MKRHWIRLFVAAGLSLPFLAPAEPASPREPLPLGLALQPAAATTTNSAAVTNTFPLSFTLAGPGAQDIFLTAPAPSWFGLGELHWTLVLSGNVPSNVQALVFLKDWDYLWYQRLLPGYVTPGATNTLRANLSPAATGWDPHGHHASWSARTLMEPREVGIRVFTDSAASRTSRTVSSPPPSPTWNPNSASIQSARSTKARLSRLRSRAR